MHDVSNKLGQSMFREGLIFGATLIPVTYFAVCIGHVDMDDVVNKEITVRGLGKD